MEEYAKIVRLIIYSIARELSESEQQELDSWIEESGHRRELADALESQPIRNEEIDFDEADLADVWKKAQAKVQAIPGATPLPDRKEKKGLILPFSVAWRFTRQHWKPIVASLVLILAGFAIFNGKASPARQMAGLVYNDEPEMRLSGKRGQKAFHKGKMNLSAKEDRLIVTRDRPPAVSDSDRYKVITPNGVKYEVVMPDKSALQMSVASRLKFIGDYGAQQRQIFLEEGEVYFDVNSNSDLLNKPFIVLIHRDSGDVIITATGTKFNVRAYAEDSSIRATLLTGSLVVRRSGDTIRLAPGQAYVLNRDGSYAVEGRPYTHTVIPWREGRFYFHDEPLTRVFEELGRWYNSPVKYRDGIPPAGNITLEFPRLPSINSILDQIRTNAKINYTMKNDTVVIWR